MIKSFAEAIGTVGCAIVVLIAVIFGGGAMYVVYLNTLGVAQTNAQRNVTTHTQQYVQTQQQVLINLYSDYLVAPDAAHKASSTLQICAQAAMLDPLELPIQVAPFIAQTCH